VGFDPIQYLPVIWLWINQAITNHGAMYARVASSTDDAVSQVLKAGDGSLILLNDRATQAEYKKLATDAAKTGAKVCILLPDVNSRGALTMGVLPDRLPGSKPVSSANTFDESWGSELPTAPGLATWDILSAAAAGTLKTLYIVGSNPAASYPDPDLAAKALETVDRLIVQDLFLTESAQYAGVFLPASSFLEKEGVFTNIEGRVQQFDQAFKPKGDSRPDWQILLDLYAKVTGEKPFETLADIRSELNKVIS